MADTQEESGKLTALSSSIRTEINLFISSARFAKQTLRDLTYDRIPTLPTNTTRITPIPTHPFLHLHPRNVHPSFIPNPARHDLRPHNTDTLSYLSYCMVYGERTLTVDTRRGLKFHALYFTFTTIPRSHRCIIVCY